MPSRHATVDPSTGSHTLSTIHQVPLSYINDVAYLSLMVWVYDVTGLNRVFVRLPEEMIDNPVLLQAVRYGSMFASMIELRAWLTMLGITTDLSDYLETAVEHLQNTAK